MMPPAQFQGRLPSYPVAGSAQPNWSVAPAPAHAKLTLPPPPPLPHRTLTLPSPAELGINLGAPGLTAVAPVSATP